VRNRELDSWEATSHPQIQVIQGTGAYPEQNFVGPDFGLWDIFILQHAGPSGLMDPYRFHLFWILL
jgi:hypothetical protein